MDIISSYLWTSNPQKTRWHPTWNSHWMKFASASTCASNIVLQKKMSWVHAALTFTLSYFGLKHIESTQATCHLTVPAPFLTVPAPFLTVPALSSRFTHGSPLCKRAVICSYSNQFQRLAKQDLHFTCSRVFRFCWHVFVFLHTSSWLRFACPHACGPECCSCIIIIIVCAFFVFRGCLLRRCVLNSPLYYYTSQW